MAKVKSWRAYQREIHRFLTRDPQSIAILLALLVVGVLVAAITLVPSYQPFEGSLTVSQLGFTSDQAGQLFLKNVEKIQKLSGSGVEDILIIPGPFESKANPRLNALEELKVRLPNVSSRWVIEPVNPKSSDLTLGELPLQENARVSELKYYAPDRTLSFLLEPDKTAGPSSGTPVLSELKIVPGGDPLKVTLQDYELLDLKDAAGDRVLELTLLSPEQFTIPLSRRTRLSIQQAPGEQPAFWGDLAVNQVDFTRVLQSAKDFSNNVLDSTILSGKVRMSERQLEIEEHQFLLINGQPVRLPGIQTLLRLQVAESDRAKEAKSAEQKTELQKPGPKTSEKGLKVAISGHARKVEVGLNPRLPVSKIQATLIEQWLPRDVAIAVISFLSAIFASLATLAINRFLTKPEASS